MPNDFSSDSRCKALYQFENNLQDSKGGNDLTNVGVSFSTDKKEGSYSADFEQTESDYAYRTDANLDANFPFKSGDTVKKISVCCWIKPESYQAPGYIFAKHDTSGNRRSFALVRDTITIKIYSGYNNGASHEILDTGYSASNAEWYHVGVSFDGLNKTCLVHIFRASNSTTATYKFRMANETYIANADVTVGARHGGGNYYDGLIDELVVFNDLLSSLEIDAIRSGTYSGPMPLMRVETTGALVGYQRSDSVRAEAAGLLVAYSLTTTEEAYLRAEAIGMLVAYSQVDYQKTRRVFPVSPPQRLGQTQGLRRVLPI